MCLCEHTRLTHMLIVKCLSRFHWQPSIIQMVSPWRVAIRRCLHFTNTSFEFWVSIECQNGAGLGSAKWLVHLNYWYWLGDNGPQHPLTEEATLEDA